MLPLSMVKEGQPCIVGRVGGKDDTRRFLETLGFVTGAAVTVVSAVGGNLIVMIRNSRIAIGRDMANKVLVDGREEIS